MASQYTRIQIGADRAYSAHQVALCINFVSQVDCIDFFWTRSGLDEIWTINCSLILNTVQTVRFYSFRIYLKNLTKYKVHKKIPGIFLSFQCETFLLVSFWSRVICLIIYIYTHMCAKSMCIYIYGSKILRYPVQYINMFVTIEYADINIYIYRKL